MFAKWWLKDKYGQFNKAKRKKKDQIRANKTVSMKLSLEKCVQR